jgi:hypothetical protein
MVQQPPVVGQGLPMEASRSYPDTPPSVRLLSPTQWPVPDNTQQSLETDTMAPVGFEPALSASEQPQIHALDRTAIVIGRPR